MLAAIALGAMAMPTTKTGREGRIDQAVKGVAAFLGDTLRCAPAAISIHASSIVRGGATIAAAQRRAGALDEAYLPSAHRRIERAVVRLLSG